MYRHDQMHANAVSQRAACVLVPRPLNHGLSDAASTHIAPRNSCASVSATAGVLAAYGTLGRSLAMYQHGELHANAVSQRRTRQ
jgi:hypothetical protein